MLEKTLVILKPSAVQRGLIGEVIGRFEKKGLILAGLKMAVLSDEVLSEHYSHLKGDEQLFNRVKNSMKLCPVIVCCLKGNDVVKVVRTLTGVTNSRNAQPGTIRGDLSVSILENIIHASDSPESAEFELKQFFNENEIFDYDLRLLPNLYAVNEI